MTSRASLEAAARRTGDLRRGLGLPGARRLLTVLLAAQALAACGELCTNDVVQTLRSPDGRLDAIVFTRSCRATTGYTTQLSVLPAGSSPPEGLGNTLSVRGDPRIMVRWEGRRRLRVTGLGDADTALKLARIGDVEVVYGR
jgi:hypothetical protein